EDVPRSLLDAVARGRTLSTLKGEVDSFRTAAFGPPGSARELPFRPGNTDAGCVRAEFGDRFVMKIFRRIDPGVSPDLELARHLSESVGFAHTPALAGALEYRLPDEEPRTLAVLRARAPAQGDAWMYALDQVGRYLERIQTMSAEQWRRAEAEMPAE